MKKPIIFFTVLIILTYLMIAFVTHNFPVNMVEVCLSSFINPERIDSVIKNMGLYDYYNIYDVFSDEGYVSVYTGDVSLFLQNKSLEDNGLTYDTHEAIMGDRYMKKYYDNGIIGGVFSSNYGDYYVNCIIKNCDRVYYRDTNILENNSVKNQRLYISLNNKNGIVMDASVVVNQLSLYEIGIEKSIVYQDVINTLKKFMILWFVIIMFLLLSAIYKAEKRNIKAMVDSYKKQKYDIELKNFLLTKNIRWQIVRLIIGIALFVLNIYLILIFIMNMMNVYVSYDIDFTSVDTLVNTIKGFLGLIQYYLFNGFTDISILIVGIILTYVFTSLIYFLLFEKRINKMIK